MKIIEYYCSFSLSTVLSKQDCEVKDLSLLSSKSRANQGSEPLVKLWLKLRSECSPCLHSCLLTRSTSLLSDLQCMSSREKGELDVPSNTCSNTSGNYFISSWLRRTSPPSQVEEQPGERSQAGAEVADVQSRVSLCSLMVAMATPGH